MGYAKRLRLWLMLTALLIIMLSTTTRSLIAPLSAEQTQESDKYSISGMVYYSNTPLDGVTVELLQGDEMIQLQNTTTDNGYYSFSSVAPGSYYVRVYAPSPEYTDWIASIIEVTSKDVSKDMYLPKKMTLLSPENNALVSSLHPTLYWEPISEAAEYSIQINVEEDWELVEVGHSPFDNYTIGPELTPGVEYVWQVDARDAQGHWVGTTQMAYHFTTLEIKIGEFFTSILNLTPPEFGYGPIMKYNGQYALISDGNVLLLYDGNSFMNLTNSLKSVIFTDLYHLERIVAIGWNGEYWLIGGSYGLVKFDGENFTALFPTRLLGGTIMDLDWNGEYWLIGTRGGLIAFQIDAFGNKHYRMIDWPGFLGISGSQGEAWAVRWNGEYWLIGGDNSAFGGPILLRYDGSEFLDLSHNVKDLVGRVAWNGEYWLIGTSEELYRYDGNSFEELTNILKQQIDLPEEYFYPEIIWTEDYWLIGIEYPFEEEMSSLGWFNGSTFIDLSTKIKELKDWTQSSVPFTFERCSDHWLIAFSTWNSTKLVRTKFDFQLSWDVPSVVIPLSQSADVPLTVKLTEGSNYLVPGSVTLNCESPEGVKVTFSPSRGSPDFSSTASIDVASSASPGDYTLTAIGGISSLQRKATITIRIPAPTGNLKIIVQDENENPISGATVSSTSQPSGQQALTGTSGVDGIVLFNDVHVGSYTFQASKSGYVTETGSVSVPTEETIELTISLQEKLSTPEEPSGGGGIPGFPYESIMLGLVVGSLIFWILQRRK